MTKIYSFMYRHRLIFQDEAQADLAIDIINCLPYAVDVISEEYSDGLYVTFYTEKRLTTEQIDKICKAVQCDAYGYNEDDA